MTNNLVIKALKNAYYSQNPDKNKQIIVHTYLGSQYTINDLKELYKEFNIIQSFVSNFFIEPPPYFFHNCLVPLYCKRIVKKRVYSFEYTLFGLI